MKPKFLQLIIATISGLVLALTSTAALADGPQTFANCRLGIGGAYSPYVGDYNTGQLNMGLYHDWGVRADPATAIGLPNDVEYIQTVRVHQLKDCDNDGKPDIHCIGSYIDPPAYSVSPDLATIASIAASKPGMLWRIGNEIERVDWGANGGQDEIIPELYATAFHDISSAIKAADPTARVAIGSVILASPLRLAYLDRVWNAYQNQYGYAMGQDIDVWVLHTFLIREVEGSWGADVPAGFSNMDSDLSNDFDPALGFLYGVPEDSMTIFDKHHDLNEFKANIISFRTWMANHGEQNKPLLNTEFGILYRGFYDHVITNQQVKDFLTGSFDYLFSAADPTLGFPHDEYRLVQGWVWYSLEDTYWNGNIFTPANKNLSEYGQTWLAYVSDAAHPLASIPQHNLRVTHMRAVVEPTPSAPGPTTVVHLFADIANSGNRGITDTLAVSFWNGNPAAAGSVQIGSTQYLSGLPGCGRFATISVDWPVLAGQYNWYVKVDPLSGETSTTDNTAGSTVTVSNLPLPTIDLSTAKNVNNPTPFTGEIITYTVTVANSGPDTATDVALTETPPGGISLLNASASQGTYTLGTGVWSIGTMTSQTQQTLTLTARVLAGWTGQTITNVVTVDGHEWDTNPSNNAASASIQPVSNADLLVQKAVSNPTPYSGETITYTIIITNAGPEPATGVTLTETMPAQLTIDSFAVSTGTFSSSSGLWSVGGLPVSGTARLTISTNIPAGLVGQVLSNLAQVTGHEADRFPTNNTASISVTPAGNADVTLTKTVDNTTPYSTETITFTLAATNDGPEAAVAVTVLDVLPAGLSFGQFAATQGEYTSDSGTWTVGILPAGQTATATLAAIVSAGYGGATITNRASITSPGTDLNTANNVAQVDIWPVAHTDLALAPVTQVDANSVVFKLNVTNFGPDTATGVMLENFVLPTGLTLSNYHASQGVFIPATGIWNIGSLAAAVNATLTVTTTAQTGQTFSIADIRVSGNEFDPLPGNNTRSASADVANLYYLPLIFKNKP